MLKSTSMSAMRLHAAGTALSLDSVARPVPRDHEVLLEVLACGVCRTDLHVVDGELPDTRYPITPGHEVVGRVIECGRSVTNVTPGDRVGVPWLAHTCGVCRYCRDGMENLCEFARFTGYTVDGGLGLYGFGASAHLLAQVARAEGRYVFAFSRPGDLESQQFARSLGAVWAGSSDEKPPEALDAAIIFAPVGALVPAALTATRKGGRVVCAGIHMSDIPSFPYELLWGERSICSVANLTRMDGQQFMELAARIDLRPAVETFDLYDANSALERLRRGNLTGAAVLLTSRASAHA